MVSIKNILCPIDLTPESDEALRYAISLANSYDALLFVMHCIERLEAPVEELVENVKDSIIAAVDKWTKGADHLQVKWEMVILFGDPVVEIDRVASENRADLIVIGSHPHTVAGGLSGSTAESICHTSCCPVLVIHPNERGWHGQSFGEIRPKRVLIAYDFSSDAELALAYGLSLSREFQAEVRVINLLDPENKPRNIGCAAISSAGCNHGCNIRRHLSQTIPPETLIRCRIKYAALNGALHRELLPYAQDQKIDLICMGANGLEAEALDKNGSSIDTLLRNSPCPVLIARSANNVSSIPDRS